MTSDVLPLLVLLVAMAIGAAIVTIDKLMDRADSRAARRVDGATAAEAAASEERRARKHYEAKHGTPEQRAKAQQALHDLAVELDLRNGDGALWSIEYPAPKETP